MEEKKKRSCPIWMDDDLRKQIDDRVLELNQESGSYQKWNRNKLITKWIEQGLKTK